jgi:hypothetical protein
MSDGELSRLEVMRVLDGLDVASDTRFTNDNHAQEILLQRSLKRPARQQRLQAPVDRRK